MADDVLLVISTFPDEETARKIGMELVSSGHGACVNILPRVESIYWWEGKLENSSETIAFFKVSAARYAVFQEALRKLHPYDVPEIIALPVQRGLPEYLRWVTSAG